jgi:hypothetical protein
MTYYSSSFNCNRSAESQINNVFETYAILMREQREEAKKSVTHWVDRLQRDVNAHVRTQTKLIDEQYTGQLNRIGVLKAQHLNAVSKYEQQNQFDRVRQLLTDCQNLQFSLNTMDSYELSVAFDNFMMQRQLKEKQKADKSKINK